MRRSAAAATSDGSVNEGAVVMKALREFNAPKITASDTTIFRTLLTDLFPDAVNDASVVDEFRERCEVRRDFATTVCCRSGCNTVGYHRSTR